MRGEREIGSGVDVGNGELVSVLILNENFHLYSYTPFAF